MVFIHQDIEGSLPKQQVGSCVLPCCFFYIFLTEKEHKYLKGLDIMKNTKIIAIANQKGGVGKKTTAANLGAALQRSGFETLLIDFDPQGSLSRKYMQYVYTEETVTINELMKSVIAKTETDVSKAILHNNLNNIDYIAADIRFSEMEMTLVNTRCRETVLQRLLKKCSLDYDYIVIDCPPFLGNLLYNALTAADYVLIPVAAQEMAIDGIPLLLDTIDDVCENTNSDLEIAGVIPTLVEKTKMSQAVIEELSEYFNDKLIGYVSKSTAARDSSKEGLALCQYKHNTANKYKNKLAEEYANIANEIVHITR